MDVNEVNQKVIEQFRAGGAMEGMHRRVVAPRLIGTVAGQYDARVQARVQDVREQIRRGFHARQFRLRGGSGSESKK